MQKIFISILLLISFAIGTMAQTTIKGSVKDSITGEPLPYVSIILKGTTIGNTTDLDGRFLINSSSKVRTMVVSYLGYRDKTILVTLGRVNNIDIKLVPTSIALDEVVVKPKHERYTKKENPAVIFVRNVISHRESSSPRNHDYFCYNRYEKMVFALNDYHPKERKPNQKAGKFDFLSQYVDTIALGKTILPVSEKEKIENVYYRKDPKTEKSVISGIRSAGIDEIFSRDGIRQLLGEVFRETDIFKNDIPLFLQRFVSPLSTIGPDFYKYYLLDTLDIEGKKYVDLGFVPHVSESFGFTGHMYVTLDSTFFVKRILLNVPQDINLNFVHGMSIEQEFLRTDDGTRLITKDDINLNFKLSKNEKGMYARRLCLYGNQSFDPPKDLTIFNQEEPERMITNAYTQNEKFWNDIRPEEAGGKKGNSVDKLMAQLRSIPIFYVTEKVVSILVSGYVGTHKDKSKNLFEFGPANTFISGNAVEGGRFRLGGTTTTSFSKRFFLDGFLAYGTKDEKLKYDAIAEYSFIDKKEYRKEFPVRSLRLEMSYDINELGQDYMYTNKDNMFLAWKRQKDNRVTYIRKAELTYYNERYSGFAYGAAFHNFTESSTKYAEFNRINSDGTITPKDHYNMSELEFRLRYAPNEKFYQTRNYRYPITYDAPIFSLKHTVALKGFLGADYNYNKTEFGFEKRFWFSAFGYIDIITKAAKVWNKVPYPLLLIPNANMTYTIQPEQFTNLNAMEFLNDEYASWDVTYYMNGWILNQLPLIKKLKWREVFSYRGMFGSLSDKNDPSKNGVGLYQFPEGTTTMSSKPYMEAGVGIENILKFIRIDYVWRLSYRDNPNIQKRGFRFVMKVSF